MKILLLGGGGREHALATKIIESEKCDKLFIAPGNAGTRLIGENVNLKVNDFNGIATFCIENDIKMLVVGPEDPLVNGIANYFSEKNELSHIKVIGPSKEAAILEGSKAFSKEFMKKYSIPTAAYETFTENQLEKAYSFLENIDPPYVLKADGLAAGKGVLILHDLDEAKSELTNMMKDAKFGDAGKTVVIEEFLKGIELSVFVLTDGKDYKILPSAKDYKRIGEGDTGLNTGGMGSISPVIFADEAFMDKIENQIIKPTIKGLIAEGIEYKGFIFFGLINVEGNPMVIEYNARMGDPEAESVLPRLNSDIVELFEGVADGNLSEKNISIDPKHSVAVMLVSGGYPEAYEKGKVISGLVNVIDGLVFHAGTTFDEATKEVKTSGGRVIAVHSFGDDIETALQLAYKKAEEIDFEKKYYRTDLGLDLINFQD